MDGPEGLPEGRGYYGEQTMVRVIQEDSCICETLLILDFLGTFAPLPPGGGT